ncbi:MAG: hypothetical protein M3186_09715 [Actinomycetota bacterium]|nr:hypothetical protein [Actinomycetota bacterium]
MHQLLPVPADPADPCTPIYRYSRVARRVRLNMIASLDGAATVAGRLSPGSTARPQRPIRPDLRRRGV